MGNPCPKKSFTAWDFSPTASAITVATIATDVAGNSALAIGFIHFVPHPPLQTGIRRMSFLRESFSSLISVETKHDQCWIRHLNWNTAPSKPKPLNSCLSDQSLHVPLYPNNVGTRYWWQSLGGAASQRDLVFDLGVGRVLHRAFGCINS